MGKIGLIFLLIGVSINDLFIPYMQVIKGKMLLDEFNVGTTHGSITSNIGGFNFLNNADNLATAAGNNFFDLYNKPWLQKAIQRGDDIILATRPVKKLNI